MRSVMSVSGRAESQPGGGTGDTTGSPRPGRTPTVQPPPQPPRSTCGTPHGAPPCEPGHTHTSPPTWSLCASHGHTDPLGPPGSSVLHSGGLILQWGPPHAAQEPPKPPSAAQDLPPWTPETTQGLTTRGGQWDPQAVGGSGDPPPCPHSWPVAAAPSQGSPPPPAAVPPQPESPQCRRLSRGFQGQRRHRGRPRGLGGP